MVKIKKSGGNLQTDQPATGKIGTVGSGNPLPTYTPSGASELELLQEIVNQLKVNNELLRSMADEEIFTEELTDEGLI